MRYIILSLIMVSSLFAQDKLVLSKIDKLTIASIHNADFDQAEKLIDLQIEKISR